MIDFPDVPVFQARGNRRSIRYYDPDRKVEDWKIEAMLQAARFSSCQGNINATEAIVVQKETWELWDEIEECVSGFNVQVINQCSHVIFWLTNLHAWYGRANDGISSLALAGAATHYHGWNYEFTMTQTVPRLMSFPVERTDTLRRFESGQAVADGITAGVALRVGNPPHAVGRKPGGGGKAVGVEAQRKSRRAIANLQVGDEVITNSGFFGKVVGVTEPESGPAIISLDLGGAVVRAGVTAIAEIGTRRGPGGGPRETPVKAGWTPGPAKKSHRGWLGRGMPRCRSSTKIMIGRNSNACAPRSTR